jgi:hypothetical protein
VGVRLAQPSDMLEGGHANKRVSFSLIHGLRPQPPGFGRLASP